MTVLFNPETGEARIVSDEDLDRELAAPWEVVEVDLPEDFKARQYILVNGAWAVRPPDKLAPDAILSLFTIAERAAARRMLTAVWPVGHPMAGQLVDPEGNIQVLLDSLIARRDPVERTDTLFVQGIEALVLYGILTPERAARAAQGLPPVVPA
ncbi:hypothetical protein [Polymorphobacter sp.]|uniref:hypothetical protein n=1 Tax=Polymorphobacter sp. TaxID=1909290 RepID=UPI003F6EF0A1